MRPILAVLLPALAGVSCASAAAEGKNVIVYQPDIVAAGRLFMTALNVPVETPKLTVTVPDCAELLDRTPLPAKTTLRKYYFRALKPAQEAKIVFALPAGQVAATFVIWSFDDLRQFRKLKGVQLPRRWPLGEPLPELKEGQTVTTEKMKAAFKGRSPAGRQWLKLTDDQIWALQPDSIWQDVDEISGYHHYQLFPELQDSVYVSRLISSNLNYAQLLSYRYGFSVDGQVSYSPSYSVFISEEAALSILPESYRLEGVEVPEFSFVVHNRGAAPVEQYRCQITNAEDQFLTEFERTNLALNGYDSLSVSLNLDPGENLLHIYLLFYNGQVYTPVFQDSLEFMLLAPAADNHLQILENAPQVSLVVPADFLDHYLALRVSPFLAEYREVHSGQPGISALNNGNQNLQDLFFCSLDSQAVNLTQFTLTFTNALPLYRQEDSQSAISADGIYPGFWDPELGYWVPIRDIQRDSLNDTLAVSWNGTQLPRILRLLYGEDLTPPEITYSVGSQYFAPGDFIARNPDFGFTLSDVNGLDLGIGGHPPVLRLDGEIRNPEDYTINGTGVYSLLSFIRMEELETNREHTLELEISDLFGNSTVSELVFQVADQMLLTELSNHPNPFAEHTTIAWYLTDVPERISCRIFTASGRLVRRLDPPFPQIGYGTTVWDGRDDYGRRLANGVYFLKFTVQRRRQTIEKIIKLAKLR